MSAGQAVSRAPCPRKAQLSALGTGVLIVCLAVLVAKCGGSSEPSDSRQRAADAVKRFEDAAINRDGTTYCALLTDSERSYVLRQVNQSVGLQGPRPTAMRATLHLFVSSRTHINARVKQYPPHSRIRFQKHVGLPGPLPMSGARLARALENTCN
jgi:hypothetical protein